MHHDQQLFVNLDRLVEIATEVLRRRANDTPNGDEGREHSPAFEQRDGGSRRQQTASTARMVSEN
jgi:hypothetical protein